MHETTRHDARGADCRWPLLETAQLTRPTTARHPTTAAHRCSLPTAQLQHRQRPGHRRTTSTAAPTRVEKDTAPATQRTAGRHGPASNTSRPRTAFYRGITLPMLRQCLMSPAAGFHRLCVCVGDVTEAGGRPVVMCRTQSRPQRPSESLYPSHSHGGGVGGTPPPTVTVRALCWERRGPL